MTPVIPLIYALDYQLDMFAEGLEAPLRGTRQWPEGIYMVREHGMAALAEAGAAQTVATVRTTGLGDRRPERSCWRTTTCALPTATAS